MSNTSVTLRALEPSDLDTLYRWENDDRLWLVSATTRPLSKQTLQFYIDSVNDIYTDKQVRLMIDYNGKSIGCIDLFEFDPLHQRAGVGIMIDTPFEGKGLASESLLALKKYAFEQLGLHQLFCNISENNTKSITLFAKANFTLCGTKKDWVRVKGKWQNELIFQCINN